MMLPPRANLREIDATLDVERVLDFIQAHGADVWLVNAGGILSPDAFFVRWS